MIKIELADYKKRIESLIGMEKWDEAVLHCKHILKSYPKYYEIYVLLGRIYLERQAYAEGFDILQRILSVEPDDFFSHIGLSVIYEDIRNSNRALYHMERAFEIQNSNKIILEELSRLSHMSGDSLPARIRMSRGALIKQYYKSGLLDQAIIESAAYLKKHPERLDIAVIMAKSLHAKGALTETIDLSRKILGKLPYCREILKMLAEIIHDPNDEVEAEMLQKRILEIDPYTDLNFDGKPGDSQEKRSILIEPFSTLRTHETQLPSFEDIIEKGFPASTSHIDTGDGDEELDQEPSKLKINLNLTEDTGENLDLQDIPAHPQGTPDVQASMPDDISAGATDLPESPQVLTSSGLSGMEFPGDPPEHPENTTNYNPAVDQ